MKERPTMKQSTACVPARTIGIDLSDDSSKYCILGANGETIEENSVPTTIDALTEAFEKTPPSRVVIEACTLAHWVARHFEEMGHEVIIANPRQLPLISKSMRKTDRNDARILARVGRLDPCLLSPVQPRSEKCLAVRALLGARKKLVGMRTGLICQVRTECKVHGVRLVSASSEGFAKVARRELPEILHAALLPVIEMLEELTKRVRGYDRKIEELCKHEYPETEVLRRVRGVGPVVALAYVATIGDPKRFKDSRNVGAYLGLVPRSYQSGSHDPNLRISKQGDRLLRTLLVNSATHIMRRSSPDSSLKRLGKRIANRGNPRDRARARIAVARKLAVVMHHLLRTGEVYDPMRGATA
jgi:transposase